MEAAKGVGLKGYWMGYFAGRVAPMGPVPAEVVMSTFFNFHPTMVERAIPDAWGFASPEEITEARTAAMDATLQRVLGDMAGADAVSEAADLAEAALAGAGVEGRALYGAWASFTLPAALADTPHMRLWRAATLVREHRGDGHLAALTHAGLDGCEAHVSVVAAGRISREVIQGVRGWSDDEWAAAETRMRDRGWLADDGSFTDGGAAVRKGIEDDTDRLAMGPVRALGAERAARLVEVMAPIAGQVIEAGGVPMPNPMGAPRPRP